MLATARFALRAGAWLSQRLHAKGPHERVTLALVTETPQDQLIGFFKDHPERPWHVQDVQKAMGIDDRAALKRDLDALVADGKLIKTRRRSYGLPGEMNLIPGRLQVAAGGFGFVIREDGETPDIHVGANKLGGAWNGDRVMVRPLASSASDRPSGEVVRIIERKNDRIVGTLEYAQGYAILRPDSPRLRERILLTPDSVGRIDAGLRLVVRMVWPEESGEADAFGEVLHVLGEQDDPEVETQAVIVNYDLKDSFDADTLAEADAVPDAVTGDMMAGRTDYRHVNTFTIDGSDAKDFDDALSLERLDDTSNRKGMLRVGVHIADVSYYVAEGTSLDNEAKQRATSVYLPGRVLPMLPESLSNGICSLVEGRPRLALSVFVDVTRDGEVKAMRMKETVIESNARLTYDDVQQFLDGDRLPRGYRKLERDVKALSKLTERLREDRMGAGALDFDFTEAKVDVDDEGELNLIPIRSNAARQLIEELMLLANRMVAQELQKKDIPALYRVHEDPSEAKIEALQKGLQRLGYDFDVESARPIDLQRVLKAVAGKPEAQLVSTLLLRSLKQARYSSENLGHFGLAFENYLHFTSPIRRYPDLVVHRVVRALLQHRLSPTLKERMRSDFPDLATHTSERERGAEEAERDLARYYHAKWAREHLGEAMHGFVSGVTNFGVFVALHNGVEGLIHVSHLDDDYYVFVEEAMMLSGKSGKRRYRMGDRVEVRILNANPTARQIDFIPASSEMPDVVVEEPPKRQKAPRRVKAPLADPAAAREAVKANDDETAPAANGGGSRAKKASKPQPKSKPKPASSTKAEPATAKPKKRRKLVFGPKR